MRKIRSILFFFFFHHPSTHVERRIRRRMDEEDEIGATPYCSVDKYSDRAREFSSLSGREKPGRKIHRSPWNDVYIPLKRESSLYERSHLPDKGTNNRSLPSPPSPPFFSSPREPETEIRPRLDSGTVRSRDKRPISRGCPRAIDFSFFLSLWSGLR